MRRERAMVWTGALVFSLALGVGSPAGLLGVPTPDVVADSVPGTSSGSEGASSAQERPVTMSIGGRVQVRLTHAMPEDEASTSSASIRRGRLSASGEAYDRFQYVVQLELSGSSVRLIDATVRYHLAPELALWFGQGKAFFGRQQLTSSGSLQLVDRTIVDDRFSAGRQLGVALTGTLAEGLVEYGTGVYNGEGINQPNTNDRVMTVGRLVLTPLGPYAPVESAHDFPEEPRLAVGLSGFRNTVGEEVEAVRASRLNGEAAFKLRGLSATAEAYREWRSPAAGASSTVDGWYAQGGVLLPGARHEVAGRYARIGPETLTPEGVSETGVVYSHYIDGHRTKVQTDLRNVRDRATGRDHRELRVQFQLSF